MPSELDRWLRLSGRHMTSSDSSFRLYIALWFSIGFSKAPLFTFSWDWVGVHECESITAVLGCTSAVTHCIEVLDVAASGTKCLAHVR